MAAAIVALGYVSFTKLPITRMPNVDVPVISVTITQFGAAPAELESRVTKAVEDAVSGVAGSHHINSVITDGISNTTILFRLETDTDRALNDVKDAVTSIRANLPRGIDEPMIQRVDIAGLPILTYAAIAPGKTPEQLSWFVEDVVTRALQGVRGVARVERIGSVEREIRVGLDPVRLQSVSLTPLDVSRQLRGSNVDLAGGRAEIGGHEPGHPNPRGGKDHCRSGCDENCSAGGRRSAVGRSGSHHRHDCGASDLCALQWRACRRLQYSASQRRKRCRPRRGSRRSHRRHQGGQSDGRPQADRHLGHPHVGKLPIGNAYAV